MQGLRAGVPGREVLRGVDLTVRSGEVHAVMGPNGSGKSTLAHVLMGKPGYEVLGGSVTLDGEDLLALPTRGAGPGSGCSWRRSTRSRCPGCASSRSLAEALAGRVGVGRRRGGGRAAAAEAARVGLEPRLLDRPLNVDLSGGERKRSETLQLAVLRPTIAVLDELDSGIDVDGLRDVARRVREAVDEWGLGVLAITHYRRLLSVLRPDAVHVLVQGRIVASGGPELADELERTGYAAVRGGRARRSTTGSPAAPPG